MVVDGLARPPNVIEVKTKLTCRQAERGCWGLMWTNWSHSCFTWLVNSRGKATAFHSYMTLSCHQFRFDKKVVLNWCTWNENSGSSSRNLVFLTDHSVSSFLAKSKFLKDKLTEWLVLSAGQTSVRGMVDVPSGFCWFSVWVLFPVVFFGWEFVFYYMLEFWARIRENHRLYVNDVHRPHDITCLLLGAAIFTHPLLLSWRIVQHHISIMRWKVQPVPPLGARLWTVGRCQSTWRGPAQVEENMQVLHLKTLN